MTALDTSPVPHPARFSGALLPVIARHLDGYPLVLDPMAGVGTLARYMQGASFDHHVVSNEMEWEWYQQCPEPKTVLDAADLPTAWAASFDAIATSPTYGNRMADHHEAAERCRPCRGSGDETFGTGVEAVTLGDPCPKCDGTGYREYKRNTYRHTLGRPLTAGNTGKMQWGQEYRSTHEAIIAECVRVLRPGGRVVWNVKDHIRKGEVVPVVEWHVATLEAAGLVLESSVVVACPGNRHGANGQARLDHEWVLVLDRPDEVVA